MNLGLRLSTPAYKRNSAPTEIIVLVRNRYAFASAHFSCSGMPKPTSKCTAPDWLISSITASFSDPLFRKSRYGFRQPGNRGTPASKWTENSRLRRSRPQAQIQVVPRGRKLLQTARSSPVELIGQELKLQRAGHPTSHHIHRKTREPRAQNNPEIPHRHEPGSSHAR